VKTIDELLQSTEIRFINSATFPYIFEEPNDALRSFAIDDAIATAVGNEEVAPTIRLWVHERTVVLGIPDSRLPHLNDGVQYLQEQGCNVIVRNSGGLAVLIDRGVLNMSLIVPNNDSLSIHDGYDMMLDFIQKLFGPYTSQIKAYEIVGSYCPGDYDLSVRGIKFAGISQRRVRNGVAVQVYLDISGNSRERATIVKNFYERSMKGEPTTFTYPDVNPSVMGTISELVDAPFTVKEISERIESYVQTNGNVTSNNAYIESERDVFYKRLIQMKQRNKKASPLLLNEHEAR